MAWHYDEPPYVYYYPDPRFDRDDRPLHEMAPVTFQEPPYYNDPFYQPDFRYHYRDPRFDNDGRPLYGLAPAPAPATPFYYGDEHFRRDFRHHHRDAGYGGHIFPHRERVYPQREDDDAPWWRHGDHPHGYYPYPIYVERQQPAEQPVKTETTVELYVPQLCCDKCERTVVKTLKDMKGVKEVTADQWNKKVAVMGVNLHPESVLYHLKHMHDIRMDRSVLWKDRRS